LLGVGNVTILDWMKKGKLKGEKIGRNWSIPPAEIERIKNSRG
jgi:excisionase family DNA binding protein